jgi:tetratricopeptide (TPR) repeat protein
MRDQKWSEARAAYAAAVTATPDRAEAHFRLAVCYVAIQRFDSAVREFKRAVDLDPKSARTAKSLKSLFGPDSQIIRTSILGKLGDWVKEDFHSSDRLFLYGAMLRLDEDPQGIELLRSAAQASNGADSSHILKFLNPNADKGSVKVPVPAQELPDLKPQPMQVAVARPNADLRFPKSATLIPAADAPVPMPDGLVPVEGGPVPMP